MLNLWFGHLQGNARIVVLPALKNLCDAGVVGQRRGLGLKCVPLFFAVIAIRKLLKVGNGVANVRPSLCERGSHGKALLGKGAGILRHEAIFGCVRLDIQEPTAEAMLMSIFSFGKSITINLFLMARSFTI
mgnify:FL=1